MHAMHGIRNLMALSVAVALSACAATGTLVTTPSVKLTSVQISKIGFAGQTFLLAFDVDNPNSFPLPIRKIRYAVMLEKQKFARGETQCDITIPAHGEGEFVISVDIDILQSGAGLASIVRSGVRHNVLYKLDGSLALDIPLTRPISFSSTGTVNVMSDLL